MADSKAKYWVGILYPENMLEDWEDYIYNLIQLPFAYCIHDKDLAFDTEDTTRKTHVHLIIIFSNTTTYKHALDVFKKLGVNSINKIEQIINIKFMYDYLIHDTDDSRKKHKHLYNITERVEGNNFDIGCYIQEDLKTKYDKIMELSDLICREGFTNYMRFFMYVRSNYDITYIDCVLKNKSHFNYMCKGMYHEFTFSGTTTEKVSDGRRKTKEETS